MKHARTALAIALLAVAQLAAPGHAQESPAPPALDADEVAALLEGDVIADVQRSGNNNRAELVCVIDAAADLVWDVIMDYDRYESWFPDQRHAVVREDNGDSHLLYGETRVPLFRNRVYELRDQTTTRSVGGQTHYVNTWDYVAGSGNLDSSTGFWYVQPLDGDASKTLVRMVVFADLGMWLPQAIINWGTRNMLPGIAEGIQEQCDAR